MCLMRTVNWTSLNRVYGSFNFYIIFIISVNLFNLHNWLFLYFIKRFDSFYWIIFQIKLLATSSVIIRIIKSFTSLIHFIINFMIDLNFTARIINAHFHNFSLFLIFITHEFTHLLIFLPWYNCLSLHFL